MPGRRRPPQTRPPQTRSTRPPSGGRRSDDRQSSTVRQAPSARRGPVENRPPRNHHGFHVLRDPAVVRAMVRSAGVGPGDLVLDLGAGPGVVTLALARTGARVIAVERDHRLARKLERRTADDPTVRVVEADLRTVPLPHRPFHVVANIPFATGTDLLRRLLDEHDRGRRLRGADLLVEWGFARRLTTRPAAEATAARWQRRFRIEIADRVPAAAFSPPPGVGAAHLVIRPG